MLLLVSSDSLCGIGLLSLAVEPCAEGGFQVGVAAFGIYLVIVDALVRRRHGVSSWLSAAILKQAPHYFSAAGSLGRHDIPRILGGLVCYPRRVLP